MIAINKLRAVRLGIDTQNEHIILMRYDCHLCRSEGFKSLTRVKVKKGGKSIVATLNVVTSEILRVEEASLSESAWIALDLQDEDCIEVTHLSALDSMSLVRAKIYGKELSYMDYAAIMKDIVAGNYSTIHLATFVTACASHLMPDTEIISLTQSMIDAGERIHWKKNIVLDKHCIGGLPNNRTSPIVVSILAALGFMIPKTSSRSITSPAGTADVMEMITNVNLNLEQLRQVVEREGACFSWGGAVRLSPADDILIRLEKAIDIDSEGQMIASVLSKKAAAGSTHVLIDIPYGDTAKVRSAESAERLKLLFEKVGDAIGLKVKVLITDGSQPIGNGIGPALEARDVLDILKNEENAPHDLRIKSLQLAAMLIEISGYAEERNSFQIAEEILFSGKAYSKFLAICQAQGRYSEPGLAPYKEIILSDVSGYLRRIDNRQIAKVAKLAGAPNDPLAGVYLHRHLNEIIEKGSPLYTVYAETPGQLTYAFDYVKTHHNILIIA